VPRVKRGTIAHKRRKRLLKQAKGFKWGRSNKYRLAKQALMKAWSYAYRDRRVRKRDFRALWQIRINAGARLEGMSYSRFMHALKTHHIELDRKILSSLAATKPTIFKEIVQKVTIKN